MEFDSEQIRHEIKRILLKNGLTKSKKLISDVTLNGIGSEKSVIVELKKMVTEGTIIEQTLDGSGSKKAYELANLSHTISKQIENLQIRLGFLDTEISMFHDQYSNHKFTDSNSYLTRIQDVLLFIHEIESIQTLIRILEIFPTFKNNPKFTKLKQHLEKTWKTILTNITLQEEPEFLQDVVSNIASTEKIIDHHNLTN